MVKKVVVSKDQYKDYRNEIRQCYELGFTPFRLYTNTDGTFVTPICVCGKVYALYDDATMRFGECVIETNTISSKLVYFVDGDGSGVALQGDRTSWS